MVLVRRLSEVAADCRMANELAVCKEGRES